MSFPWIGSSGFESATLTNCLTAPGGSTSSCTAVGTRIDAPHFTELARFGQAPYRGNYCLRARAALDTNGQYIKELTLGDQASTPVTQWTRFYFYLSKDFVMVDGDKFSLYEGESVSDTTTRVAFGIQRTTTNIEMWWNITKAQAAPATFVLGTYALGPNTALGRWRYVELKYICGAAANGSIDLYIDSGAAPAATGIGTLTQAGIVDVKYGIIGPDAGTSGTVLIDDIVIDDTQIYPDPDRYKVLNTNIFFANDHPIIGPASFTINVVGTGTNAVLTCYDSDGIPPVGTNPIIVLSNTVANEVVPAQDELQVNKGLYTTLAGTAAQSFVSINCGGLPSEGAMISYGQRNGRPRH